MFLDNDTRMLFATAYDGDWDAFIDDFATKIPVWPGCSGPVTGTGARRRASPG